MEPFGGAGVLWLPMNTDESRAHALETVYRGKDSQAKKRKRRAKG